MIRTPYPELARVIDPAALADWNAAACAGRWLLFDSIDPDDHRLAKQFCAECPILNTCRLELREVQRASAGDGASGGPRGTWAGKLIGRKGHALPGVPQEVRQARAAYVRGDRTAWAAAGNRAYERARASQRQEAS